MKNLERFFSFEDSLAKIESWCAYQDRSVEETKQKLFTYGLKEQQVQKIIAQLEDQNFLDDERFAESYVSGKFRIKHWGKKKIYAHLSQKKIKKEYIHAALHQIDLDAYIESAQNLVEKKWALLEREQDLWTRKQKVIQYVASRGYEFDVIQEAMINAQL